MIELPKTKSKVEDYNPGFMVLYGKYKTGKSSFCAALDGNLIIDLEDGYRSLEVMKVQARSYNDLVEIRKAIIQKGIEDKCSKENGKKPYRFITIDNATRLEEYCLPQAANLYRETNPSAKNWGKLKDSTGRITDQIDPKADVRMIPQGGGYVYLRQAVMESIKMFKPLCNTLILVCHVKDKLVTKDSTEMSEMSVDLAGKLSDIVCGEADAIGYLYRRKNETVLSFIGGADVLREARPLHLRNKEFVVITSDESGEIKVDTSKIFI